MRPIFVTETPNTFRLQFDYNPKMIDVVKRIPSKPRWDATDKAWIVQKSHLSYPPGRDARWYVFALAQWAVKCHFCSDVKTRNDDKDITYELPTLTGIDGDHYMLLDPYKYQLEGVRIRACQEDFILSAMALGTLAWGGTYDVATVPNYGQSGTSSVYNYSARTALELTNYINDAYGTTVRNSVTGSPAAKAALEYKAFKQAIDGVDDDSDWCLPLPKHCLILYRYINEINDVLRRAWSSDNILTTSSLWTCLECSNANAWYFIMSYGGVADQAKTTPTTVRPITLLNS